MEPGASSGKKTGAITTQNLVPLGDATPNSAVELSLGGAYKTLGIQVDNTYTGALTLQFCNDGVHWYSVGGTVMGNSIEDVGAGTAAATIASAAKKIYRANVAGMDKVRITALAAVTGQADVTLLATAN